MCFYTGIRENCDPGRKPGEGDEKRESPRDIGRVVKYTVQCIITTLPFFFFLSTYSCASLHVLPSRNGCAVTDPIY